MIAELAGVLLPVFTVTAIGYFWRRVNAPFDLEFITRLMLHVAAPCLVFDSLSRLALPLAEFFVMVGASVALLAGMAVLALVLLKVLGLSARSYLPVVAVGNTGNLGLPLALFAFGEPGLALAVTVFVTHTIGQFVLTPLLQARTPVIRTLLATPVIYAAVLGVLALAADVAVPEWLATTLGLLGDLTIPLMLIALGYTIGGLRARNLKLAFGLAGARLVLSFGVALGVGAAFRLDGVALGVLVLQGVMPAAVFNYLFAARYARAVEDVAGIVLVSTLLAAVLLPFIVSFTLWLAA